MSHSRTAPTDAMPVGCVVVLGRTGRRQGAAVRAALGADSKLEADSKLSGRQQASTRAVPGRQPPRSQAVAGSPAAVRQQALDDIQAYGS